MTATRIHWKTKFGSTAGATRVAAVIVALWLLWLASYLLVPGLITSAYEQRSLPILNDLFAGRSEHTLAYYLRAWAVLAVRAALLTALASAALVLVYAFRSRLKAAVSTANAAISIAAPARALRFAGMAALIGLCAGLLEVIILAAVHTLRASPHGGFFWDRLWMAPLAMALAMVAVAAAIYPLSRPWRPHATLGLLPGLVGVVAAYALIRAVGGVHPFAAATLAAGVVVAASRAAVAHPEVASRVVRGIGVVVIAWVAASAGLLYGWRNVSEWRRLADLPPGITGAPNVILIILDTVRAASMSLYGHVRTTTPHIDRFAARGVTFDEAWAPAAWTLPSHASIFTGLGTTELSANYDTRFDDSHPTLAETLGRRGLVSGGFVANYYYASRVSGLARGFVHYEDHVVSGRSILNSAWLTRMLLIRAADGRPYAQWAERKSGARVNRDALAWIAQQERPFFAFLNYFDAHDPYIAPEPFRSRFGGGWGRYAHSLNRRYPALELQQLENHYDGALAYLDQQVGQFLDELDARGILDNSIVVIASDHGEEFGEHDAALVTHGRSLFSVGLRVPLVVVAPGRVPPNLRVSSPVAISNIAATIMDLLDGPSARHGRSLARFWTAPRPLAGDTVLSIAVANPQEPVSPRVPVARGPIQSILLDSLHFILYGDGTRALYDVVDDPFELVNLAEPDRPAYWPTVLDSLLSARVR